MLFISIFITFVTGGPGGGRLRPLWCRSSDSVPAWGRNSLQAAAIWTPFVLPLKRPAAGSKTRDSSWKREKKHELYTKLLLREKVPFIFIPLLFISRCTSLWPQTDWVNTLYKVWSSVLFTEVFHWRYQRAGSFVVWAHGSNEFPHLSLRNNNTTQQTHRQLQLQLCD